MSAQLFSTLLTKISRSDIKNRTAARLAFLCQTIGSPCVSNEDTRREFRVGIELQRELDDMVVLLLVARSARADNEAAVCEAAVIALELLFADEVYRRIVLMAFST